jgi:hypothetical protein
VRRGHPRSQAPQVIRFGRVSTLGPRIKIARAFFHFHNLFDNAGFAVSEARMKTRLLTYVGVALLAAVGAIAQGRWQFLGEAHVDGAVDHDRITVTRAKGEYRAIQVRVAKGPIEFSRMVVHFGNGTSEDIGIRERIPAGGQTRVIDLPGARRIIESVEFWYSKANWRENRPMVRLWGRH